MKKTTKKISFKTASPRNLASKMSSVLPVLSVDLVAAARMSDGVLGGLDEHTLQRLEFNYRRFLMLKAKHPEETLAPTGAIDEMWHLHMLHPCAYHDDCIAILGRILDHNPGAGKLPGTLPQLLAHFQFTARLWAAEFGTNYRGSSTCGNDVVMCEEKEKALRTLDDVVMCEEKEKTLRTLDDVVMCEEKEKTLRTLDDVVMCEEKEKTLRTLDDVVMCEEKEKTLRTLDDVVMCEEKEKGLCIPNNAVMRDVDKDLSKWPGEQA